MAIHNAYSDAQVQQAIEILGRYPQHRYVDAVAEIRQTWGRPINTTTLCNVFKRKGYDRPTSYCAAHADTARDPGRESARSVPSANGSERSHRDSDTGIGESISFAPREPVAETNATRKVSQPAGSGGRHLADDTGAKRLLDQKGVVEQRGKLDNSDNPRVNPALHVPLAPTGYHLRGVSTLLDGEGNPVQQWVKTTQDPTQHRLDALLDAIRDLPDSFREAHAPKPAPSHLDADLLCVYPVADVHLGMYAWREETGADYDIKIAERLHTEAIDRLVAAAPNAKQSVILGLGDFFHCDSNLARTGRSGNPLDTDTRWQLVLRVGVRMMRAMIDAALRKHEQVRVVIEIGNHDDYSAVMLSMALEAFYDRDDRVTVDTSPEPFHWHRFGKCLIGVTHGDQAKIEQLPGLMAAMRAADWGQTKHRYWYTGHIHNEKVREFPGCVVEAFRSLAPADAWAHRAGYRADRDMRVDVLHREHGRITRHILGVEQVS